MIEINLLPSARRRSARRLPQLRARPSNEAAAPERKPTDPWLVLAILAWTLGSLIAASLLISTNKHWAGLDAAIEGARLDSIRYAEMRAANELLLARKDTIAQKLEIIQEIDAGRYVWAHIIDEISRALPQSTWLVSIVHLSDEGGFDAPRFAIDGRTGNTFALTRLMQDLEASPFIRNVTLMQTDQLREHERRLYTFQLEAQFENAPPDRIETVPLFGREEG